MANGVFKVKETEIPEPIPAGLYKAKLSSWEEKSGSEFGDFMRMEFEILEGDYKETKRSLIASSKLTKGKTQDTTSKLFRIVTGLMGREPDPKEEISLDDLIGLDCMILVEDRPGSEEGWQDITKVMPTQKAKIESS